jgi:hypothetical protein
MIPHTHLAVLNSRKACMDVHDSQSITEVSPGGTKSNGASLAERMAIMNEIVSKRRGWMITLKNDYAVKNLILSLATSTSLLTASTYCHTCCSIAYIRCRNYFHYIILLGTS